MAEEEKILSVISIGRFPCWAQIEGYQPREFLSFHEAQKWHVNYIHFVCKKAM